MRSLVQDLNVERLRPALKPEERLLLAVVESAFWDLQSPDPTRRQTARSYFLDERGEHTFSFISICEHFSWSPVSIRFSLQPQLTVSLPEVANLSARPTLGKVGAARR
jgi:hypothetical protein